MGLLAATSAAAAPPEPPSAPKLELAAGAFEVLDGAHHTARFGLAYVWRAYGRWALAPSVGVLVSEDGSHLTYGEIRRSFPLGRAWRATLSFGAGFFHDGGELHLGNELEFRSGLGVGRRVGRGFDLGLGFYHLSNGGISERNPGTEVLVLTIGMPISRPPARSQSADAPGGSSTGAGTAAASSFSSSRRISSPASAR